jgi:DNA (cytosine-5)-methyltransferase 1
MVAINPEGGELAPLSMAEMRTWLYGMRRAEGIDFFAGLGGLTSAFFLAGGQIKHACNHWTKSWLAHACNFPQVEHRLGDLSVLDPKSLPRGFANVLVAAPECRRHSRASNYRQAVMELSPYDPDRESERSRATMWCPQRWAAYHQFDHVVIENVVEVTDWNQFGNWVVEWQKLGYNVQAVCLNSAFFFAPQGRDRIAILATRKGLPVANLDFRPLSWCWMCEQYVYGIQRYKDAAIRRAGPLGPVGKWGPRNQYLYHCPACERVVSPRVPPALGALDRTIVAQRICDRKVPLKPKTMARIVRGAEQRGQITQLVVVDGRDGKRARPAWLPAMTQTARQEIAMFGPGPLVVPLRRHTLTREAGEPAPAVCASGQHHAIVGPDQEGALLRDAGNPCATVTAAGNHIVSEAPLIGANHEHSVPRDAASEPAAVLTAGSGGGGLFMVGGGRENNIPRHADAEPSATVTAAHSGGGLFMVGANREHKEPRDAGSEPGPVLGSAGGGELHAVESNEGMLVQVAGHTFERPGSSYTRAWPVGLPAPTQSATLERALVAPPVEGDGFAISPDAVIASYYGTGENVRSVTLPAGTQTAVDRHSLLAPPGSEGGASEQEPICIEEWTFRMLVPKEAQALMDLVVRADGQVYKTIELTDRGDGLRITSTDGVRLSGNAVCQTQWANVLHRAFCASEGREDPRSVIGSTPRCCLSPGGVGV